MIKYSIIIPHHNVPTLLERCVNSIPQRDDIQIIVVDDNSVNNDTYLEKYAFYSERILYLYQHLKDEEPVMPEM